MVKEKKTAKIEVRLPESDYHLFKLACVCIGQTPSKTVRMFIDATINSMKVKVEKGEINLEDLETLLND